MSLLSGCQWMELLSATGPSSVSDPELLMSASGKYTNGGVSDRASRRYRLETWTRWGRTLRPLPGAEDYLKAEIDR